MNVKTKVSKGIWIFILVVGYCFGTLYGQSENTVSARVEAIIDQKYSKLMKQTKAVGASIALIENGKVIYAKGFGFADREKLIKASPETVYKVCSITKTFTALAVMQLHEKGLLDVNKSIKTYLPELQISSRFDDGNEIFIKDILSHISGLPSDFLNGIISENPPAIDWTIAELNKHTTASPRRFTMAYSNLGYGLLGELIARVSGLSYEDYIRQNIFLPLEMNDSGFEEPSKLMSKGYLNNEPIKMERIRDVASGAITSSVVDMAKFTSMLIKDGVHKDKTILSAKYIHEMEQDHLINNTLGTSEKYGYGIEPLPIVLSDENGDQASVLYAHSGDEATFHAIYGYIPDLNLSAVIMTNTKEATQLRVVSRFLRLYLKEAKGIHLEFAEDQLPSNLIQTPEYTTTDLLGSYNLGPAIMEVTKVDKIKAKIEGTKIVFKKKKDSGRYSITAFLLGMIPIKMKDVELAFEKIGDKIYIKQIDLDSGSVEYIGVKAGKVPLSANWKSKFGNYKIINAFKTVVPMFNFENAKVELTEEKGLPVLEIKIPEMDYRFCFNILTENFATVGGIGRNAGNTMRILDNGNLYFSGFEMERVAE